MKEIFQSILIFLRGMSTNNCLNNDDILAKYVFRLNELLADGRVKSGNLKPREGEMLSLSKITTLKHKEICTHGHAHVDNPEKGRIHIGYGKFHHECFKRLGLKTIYDNKPPRHVSVEFPKDPEKRREIAKSLADEFITNNSSDDRKYFFTCTLNNEAP